MAIEKVRFLGYDPAGDVVFQNLEYPSDGPKTWITGTSFPQLTSPDVFKLSREAAERNYGNSYAAVNEIHPELNWRTPFSEQELAERAAEFDQRFGPAAFEYLEDGNEQRIEPGDNAVTQPTNGSDDDLAKFDRAVADASPGDEDIQERVRQARAQELGVTVEQIEHSDAFDAKYGPNALQYASAIPDEPLNEYRLVRKLEDGTESTYTIHSSNVEDATKQAWRELAKNENVAAAKLEWDGGNEVSYIYDRKQGVEIDRPAGLLLPHERQQQREQQAQKLTETPSQKQGHTREDLIRQLRSYAEKGMEAQKNGGFKYLHAEAAIAMNLADQLEAGAKTIDLSQRYATDNPSAAQARHQRALENLAPVLKEAEKQTERLQHGEAIAHGKGEVLAVQNLNRGLTTAQGVLQRAAHHNNHQTQAPRLSMSSEGGM